MVVNTESHGCLTPITTGDHKRFCLWLNIILGTEVMWFRNSSYFYLKQDFYCTFSGPDKKKNDNHCKCKHSLP